MTDPGHDFSAPHPQVPRPRFLPERALPILRYRPGRSPRPAPHGTEASDGRDEALDAAQWNDCDDYLYGIDLFNHGYYWEAHEAWEGLWHSTGRQGPTACFLKGLIALTAAGLKVLDGNIHGTRIHGKRAARQFRTVRASEPERYMGLDLLTLERWSLATARDALELLQPSGSGAVLAFDFVLWPVVGDQSAGR